MGCVEYSKWRVDDVLRLVLVVTVDMEVRVLMMMSKLECWRAEGDKRLTYVCGRYPFFRAHG